MQKLSAPSCVFEFMHFRAVQVEKYLHSLKKSLSLGKKSRRKFATIYIICTKKKLKVKKNMWEKNVIFAFFRSKNQLVSLKKTVKFVSFPELGVTEFWTSNKKISSIIILFVIT